MSFNASYTIRCLAAFALLWLHAAASAQKDSSAIRKCIPSPDTYQGQAVYTTAENMPVFGKSTTGLMNYISKNISYPQQNDEAALRSTFRVTFVIDTLGQAQNVCCISGHSTQHPVEEQLMALIRRSGIWTPGTTGGKKVCVRLTVPVTICLK